MARATCVRSGEIVNRKTLKPTYKISVFVLSFVILVSIIGCLNETENPVDTGVPNDGDNNGDDRNGNDEPIDYGTLYFSSHAGTVWRTEGQVTVSEGNITARNESSADQAGSCTLINPISFSSDRNIAITWKETITGNASYGFWISDSLDPRQQLSFSLDADSNMVSQFTMYMVSPVHLFYQFELPPNSSVIISDIHAYGK